MVKLKIWFLSGCLLACMLSHAQPSKILRDSSERYFADKTRNLYYMSVQWQLYADSALLIDPGNDELWQSKGMPYLKSGNYELAFRYYNKAVELNPQRWLSYRAFCKVIFLKDYQAGLTDFEKADTDPRIPKYQMDHTFNFYKGICYYGMGHFQKARLFFDKSLDQLRNDNGEAAVHYLDLFYLGMAYYRLGDLVNASKFLKQSEEKYPQLPEIVYYLAQIYYQQKNAFLAADYIRRARIGYEQGYRITEDNVYYANYPEQISPVEIDELDEKIRQGQ